MPRTGNPPNIVVRADDMGLGDLGCCGSSIPNNSLIDDPAYSYSEEIHRHHQMQRARTVESHDHYVLAPANGCDGLNERDPESDNQLRFG